MSGEVIAFQSHNEIELYPTHVSTWEYVSKGTEVQNCTHNNLAVTHFLNSLNLFELRFCHYSIHSLMLNFDINFRFQIAP